MVVFLNNHSHGILNQNLLLLLVLDYFLHMKNKSLLACFCSVSLGLFHMYSTDKPDGTG